MDDNTSNLFKKDGIIFTGDDIVLIENSNIKCITTYNEGMQVSEKIYDSITNKLLFCHNFDNGMITSVYVYDTTGNITYSHNYLENSFTYENHVINKYDKQLLEQQKIPQEEQEIINNNDADYSFNLNMINDKVSLKTMSIATGISCGIYLISRVFGKE